MAGSVTIGLGAGVVIIFVLWTTTAFIWVALSRSQSSLRVLFTSISGIISFVLFVIPTEKRDDRKDKLEEDSTVSCLYVGFCDNMELLSKKTKTKPFQTVLRLSFRLESNLNRNSTILFDWRNLIILHGVLDRQSTWKNPESHAQSSLKRN